MEVKLKPIPAFYCCYLLRSSVRHSSLYVGSSPHPSRRLAQHNGKAKGGAVRTSRPSLRPWEMACIVAGFPSNIAALQFEWAWQNSHLTRHISDTERISIPVTKIKTNRQTGKTRKAPGRPRTSLVDKLSNLHLLLRSQYFSKWPLELRFFSADVYKAWKTWCDRVDASLRSDINVFLDLPQPAEEEEEFSSAQRSAKRRKLDLIGKGGVDGVDPTYARYRDVFEKCQFLLDNDDPHTCDVCKNNVDMNTDLFSVCTCDACTSISHISCLSQHFLQGADSTQVVPKTGTCPSCKNEVQWSDLMRVLSLRLRGEKEVKKLMSKKKRTKAAIAAEILEEEEDENSSEDEEVIDHDASNIPNDANKIDMLDFDLDHDQDETQEHEIHNDCDIDNLSVASHDSLDTPGKDRQSPASRDGQRSHRVEIVIEDSEEER